MSTKFPLLYYQKESHKLAKLPKAPKNEGVPAPMNKWGRSSDLVTWKAVENTAVILRRISSLVQTVEY